MRSATLALLSAAVLAGCGGSGTDSTSSASSSDGVPTCSATSTFPSAALLTLTGDAGKLTVALTSAPENPPIAGLDCIQLVVTDASTGAPVDGLTATMTPWMPSMDHGASVTPLVSPLGQGRYVFTNVSLFMPGEWELRTQFSGAVTDSVNPTIAVQ
jgi:hypothetical protein